MTDRTGRLIEWMTGNLEPVRPLAHPFFRTAAWLVLAVPYVALVVFVNSPRADLVLKVADVRFIIEEAAALLTGLTAAAAAFGTTIPGYNRRIMMLPVLPVAVWLASLSQGCVESWVHAGPDGLSLTPDWYCFPAIVLVGAVPAITMAMMLRRGAPLTPYITVALGGLAAAGLGDFGLRLFHAPDASIMVLVWQFGSVVALTLLAGCTGPYLLNWTSIARFSRRGDVAG
jgi:hypothetical protein